MALINADRVKETTTTTGTGTLTLGGAVAGFQSFAAVGNANTAYCCCYAVDSNGLPTGQWETFLGTYTASGTTLARTTLIASSTGSSINFSAGTKHVIVCLPSQGTLIARTIGGTAGSSEITINPATSTIEHTTGATNLVVKSTTGFEFYITTTRSVTFSSSFVGFGTKDLQWNNNSDAQGSSGAALSAVSGLFTPGVIRGCRTDNSKVTWIQNTAGLSRVATAVTNATTTPAAITGLSATVIASRKYTGKLVLFASCPTAADGIIIDFDGGAATMTSFQAAVTSNVQGATLGTTVSSALATDINATALNGTGVNCIVIEFGFVVNAAGTFIPRVAKNADAGGATLTVAANSFMELQDAP